MIRLLTLAALVLSVAFAPAFGQDKESKSLQVTAEVVGQTFTGDIAAPEIGGRPPQA